MNRKFFLTTSAASIAGLYLTPLHSATTLVNHNQNHDFFAMLHSLKTFSLQHMPPSFVKAFTSFSNEGIAKNYLMNRHEIFQFNDTCYAMRIKKTSFFSTKNELVLFVKKPFGFDYYILDKNLMRAYEQLASNYKKSSKTMGLDLDVLRFIAPTKILEMNKKPGKKQLAFQNSYGNTITLVTTEKKNYTMVC